MILFLKYNVLEIPVSQQTNKYIKQHKTNSLLTAEFLATIDSDYGIIAEYY